MLYEHTGVKHTHTLTYTLLLRSQHTNDATCINTNDERRRRRRRWTRGCACMHNIQEPSCGRMHTLKYTHTSNLDGCLGNARAKRVVHDPRPENPIAPTRDKRAYGRVLRVHILYMLYIINIRALCQVEPSEVACAAHAFGMRSQSTHATRAGRGPEMSVYICSSSSSSTSSWSSMCMFVICSTYR